MKHSVLTAALAAVGMAAAMAAMAALAGPVAGQSPRDRLLVSADQLAARLGDPALVLLHVGPEDDYAAHHIPGARHIALSDISAPEDHHGGRALSLELPEPAGLEATLERLGIGDDARVVVYWSGSAITPATRVVLTLDWIGLGERTSLLDGGLQAWKEAGHPVTAAATPPARRAELTPRPDPDLVVTAEWVAAHLDAPGYRVVDARAPVHYDGIQPTYLHREPVRKGHIPGAASIPVSSFVDDAHRLRSAAELRALFDAAGVAAGDTVVGYCHLGQFATLLLFSARTLGHDVRLYDGSFQEWGSLEHLPVEGPPAAGTGR